MIKPKRNPLMQIKELESLEVKNVSKSSGWDDRAS